MFLPFLQVEQMNNQSFLKSFLFWCFFLSRVRQGTRQWQLERKLDLTDTIKDGARLFLLDEGIRRQLLLALTEDSKLHIQEVCNSLTVFIRFIKFSGRLLRFDKNAFFVACWCLQIARRPNRRTISCSRSCTRYSFFWHTS